MPELPEVEVIRRGLEARLMASDPPMLRQVHTSGLALRSFSGDAAILQPLIGQRLHGVHRRAKCLLLGFDAHWLLIHLGMTGQFQWVPAAQVQPALPHTHAWLTFDHGCLQFADARRFGDLRLLERPPGQACHLSHSNGGLRVDQSDLPNLGTAAEGLEPLDADFTAEALYQASRGVRQAIKPWLMTGRVVVGVGNIYASEALFRARISPKRAAGRVSRQRLAVLHAEIRTLLSEAIDAGGSTLRDYRQADGTRGSFAQAHQVYGRAGGPCPTCATPVRRIVQVQRSTFYCPACQR